MLNLFLKHFLRIEYRILKGRHIVYLSKGKFNYVLTSLVITKFKIYFILKEHLNEQKR